MFCVQMFKQSLNNFFFNQIYNKLSIQTYNIFILLPKKIIVSKVRKILQMYFIVLKQSSVYELTLFFKNLSVDFLENDNLELRILNFP